MTKLNSGNSRNKPASESQPLPGKVVKLLMEARWYILAVISTYLVISLLTYSQADPAWSHATANAKVSNIGGRIGAWLSDLLLFMFGASTWLLFIPLVREIRAGYRQLTSSSTNNPDEHPYEWAIRAGGFVVMFLGFLGLENLRMNFLQMMLPRAPGGVVGEVLASAVSSPFGLTGATMLFFLFIALGFSLYFQVSWLSTAEKVGEILERFVVYLRQLYSAAQDRRIGQVAIVKREEVVVQERAKTVDEIPTRKEPVLAQSDVVEDDKPGSRPVPVIVSSSPPVENHGEDETFEDFTVESPRPAKPLQIVKQVTEVPRAQNTEAPNGKFKPVSSTLPALSLLDPAKQHQETISAEDLEFTSRLIERKLGDFGISVQVTAAFPGPVITRYEIEPATGVKGSQIVGLSRDLARALSLTSIRVVEVIQGKNCMGLELPNAKRQIVRLTEIIGSQSYNSGSSNLTIALGKDISGNAVVADLAKMPHLLVAGTTGSGKSVGINATILSLLYKADPNDVRMILIDPKMLELSVYEGIPHLLAPVVTDMQQAGHALNWAVAEMERRYKLMSKCGVRNLAGYNEKVLEASASGNPIPNPFSLTPDAPEPLEKLPNIVIFIDELADLMMVVGKKVEELIARIAQKARAAGIHLILATQRPSVDVITGLIKANIPTRIAFQVSSKIDSRTILDQMGAESLLGMGDMLYMPPGSAYPVRVHGAFVSDEEVHRVVAFLKMQGEPNYIDGILDGGSMSSSADAPSGSSSGSSGESDEMYDQAVEVVLKNRRASISLVQRHLRIGYNRAARLLEQMEQSGLVSAMQSNGNREIITQSNAPQE